ncbi:MAG: phage tail protein [Bdellovibrionota bacterium]
MDKQAGFTKLGLFSILAAFSFGCGSPASVQALVQASTQSAASVASLLTAPLVSSASLGAPAEGQVQALGLNYYIAINGVFPSNSTFNNSGAPFLGQIMLFAGTFAPAGWAPCNGALLNISSNASLYSVIGTTFGGDGVTTFALPDLRSRVPMGEGALPGGAPLASFAQGVSGVPVISSLTLGSTGQGQVQGVGINFYISSMGVYPASGTGSVSKAAPYIGQIMLFAGAYAPAGWYLCDGTLLSISNNINLFSLLGTTYGGDGVTVFGIPDLRARAPMGVGTLSATEGPRQTATQVSMISSLGAGAKSQGQIGVLGLGYYISLNGPYPTTTPGSTTTNYVGQLLLFAGNFAPAGWAGCDGSVTAISGNASLFSLVGTLYGGDGITTFSFPDLRARVASGI